MKQLELENIETNNDYQAYREETENAALVDEFMSEFTGDAKISEPELKEEEVQEEEVTKIEEREPERSEGLFKRFAKDVGRGTIGEGPRAVAAGVTDAVAEMGQNANDFNQFIGDNFARGVLKVVGSKEQQAKGEEIIAKKKEKNKDFRPVGIPKVTFAGEELPKTVTARLIKGISQWATGFAAVGKVFKGAGFAARIVKGGLADIAAFDEFEDRLSNIIQDVPALQNVVTEYLEADPTDSKAEAKFKQFLEGAGLDLVGEALFGGVKLLKKFKGVKREVTERVGKESLEEVPELGLKASNLSTIGNFDDESFILRKAEIATKEAGDLTPEQVAKLGTIKPSSVDDIQINFARIDGQDDIKNAMQAFANESQLTKSVGKARRGVRTNQVTLTAAEDVDGFKTLLKRRSGQPLNAEQTQAARNFYYKTTDKVMELAKKAAGPEATEADQYAFRKMIAIHHATQKEVLGARAEAGRALQAWKIPAGTPGQKLKGMEKILNIFGGVDSSKELASKLATFSNGELTLSQLNAITTKSAFARTRDALSEAWTLGLLTNPVTHTKNLNSNIATGFLLSAERYSETLLPNSPVTVKEANAFFLGLLESQKEAFSNAATAFKTGVSGAGLGKVELPRIRATSKEILDAQGIAKPFGYAMDLYGKVLNNVGKALVAGDEYSKTLLYKAQIRALSVREGLEKSLKGSELTDFIATSVNAPNQMLVAQARDFAQYGTFTKELGKSGKGIQRIISQNPSLRFIVPFYKTPANIFKFTFERTPLAVLSNKVRQDIGAGGARASQALARIGMGSSIMMLGVDMSINGHMTGNGPTDSKTRNALRRKGWQPHSFKIGNKYISYKGVEPFASLFSIASDMTEILTNYEMYDIAKQEELDQVVSASVMAFSDATINKTFMSGISNVVSALAMPEQKGENFIKRQFSSVVPAGVAAVERAISPEMEYAFNIKDAFKARIPGVSESVPKRRNVYGETIRYRSPDETLFDKSVSGAIALFNPFYTSTEKDAPLDKFLLEEGLWVGMPNKKQKFDGIDVQLREYPEIYSRFLEVRGQEIELIQYGGVPMKEALTDLVSGDLPHSIIFLSDFSDIDEKQATISKIVKDYGDAAKKQLQEEFPVINQIILEEEQKQNRGL